MRSSFAFPASLALFLGACGTRWDPRDGDGDGFSPAQGDCWDQQEGPAGSGLSGGDIYPGAVDVVADGIDADCLGNDDYDPDADGYVELDEHVGLTTLGVPDSGQHEGAGDCWNDPTLLVEPTDGFDALIAADVHPGVAAADDLWYDGYDADCAGNSDFDQDTDGFASGAYGGELTFPGDFAIEAGAADRDCDDVDAAIHPDAQEVCDRDGVDEDCDALVNGADDSVDLSTALDWYADTDGDTYGDAAVVEQDCDLPDGFVADDTDCDDAVASTNPGADETCDGVDNDCDDDIDEDDAVDAPTWYTDADSDGYGEIGSEARACEQPAGTSATGEDCDDGDPAVNPAAVEICDDDNTDEDCNNLADDLDSGVDPAGYSTFHVDGDGDGYGDPAGPLDRCDQPSGYVDNAGDCDDAAIGVNPAAQEVCDAADTDEDCDGLADDADGSVSPAGYSTFYADSDGDSYGDAATTTAACDLPGGFVTDATDCDDSAAAINPAAQEVCDAADTDEDCDGDADDDDSSVDSSTTSTWYTDADGDGYGDSASTSQACDQPSGTVSDSNDCDDDASTCTTNCTSDADSDGLVNCVDACSDPDGDEYGTTNAFATGCTDATGASCLADAACLDTDCDQSDPAINPGASEVCDASNTDEDCNGVADNNDSAATGTTTYYTDSDGDGYGDAAAPEALCDLTTGFVSDDTDCDDGAASVNPAADEVCNDGADNDCDGTLGTRDAGAAYGTCAYADADVGDAAHLVYESAATDSRMGGTVRLVGDLDGDGTSDLVVGAPQYDTGALNGGGVFVLTNLDATVTDPDAQQSATTGTLGTAFLGEGIADLAGVGIAGGDLDDDGYAELFVGAPWVNTPTGTNKNNRGAVYVLDLDADWSTGGDLSARGSVAYGLGIDDELGASLSAEGDVDGDGVDDLLIGASGALAGEDGYVVLLTGASYQSGGISQTGSSIRRDAVLSGSGSEEAGTSVQLADLDGDGYSDAIVGAPEATVSSVSAGRAYFAQGPITANALLSDGASMPGPTSGLGGPGGDAGLSVGRVDVNNDGYDDALVGARGTSSADGAVSVLLGSASFFPGSDSLSADATLTGSGAEQAGFSVSGAGDVDGDGFGDILVGARAASSNAGATYLALGPVTTGTVSLSSASTVSQLAGGAAGDQAGYSVHGGFDIDTDGLDDFVVGAPFTGSDEGAAYLFLGLGQ